MTTPLYVDIDALTSKFNSKIDNALGKLDGFADNAQRIGSRLTLTLTTPLLLAATKMKNLASDFEESTNKVDVAFGKSSDVIKDFSKTTLTAFGISSGSALDMAALFGDMATSMGLSQEAAASMSTELVGLAGDLSSFKNVRLDVANTALKAIFTGETESLKNLGVVMTQANLEAFALERGLNANLQTMSEAEKVALRYAYVMDKTKNAQGDFARTGGGAANQTRIFHESLKELGQSFGAIILPYFTKAVTGLNQIIASFNALDENAKRNILIGGGIVAAFGPALLAFSSVAKAITGIKLALGAAAGPVAAFTALAIASAGLILTHWEDVQKLLTHIQMGFIQSSINFGIVLNKLGLISDEQLESAARESSKTIGRWLGDNKSGISGFTSEVKNAYNEINKLFASLSQNGGGSGAVSKMLTYDVGLIQGKLSSAQGGPENQKAWEEYFKNQLRIPELMAESGFDFKGVGERLKRGVNNIMSSMTEIDVDTPLSAFLQKFTQKVQTMSEVMQNVTAMGMSFVADTLAIGLASIFNPDVKFDFKALLGRFLSGLGDMLIQMAVQLKAAAIAKAATEGALTTFGGGIAAIGGAGTLLALGIAAKTGGAALSASAPSSSVGGGYNQGGYGSGYGTTFSPNITATFGGTVQVVADGTQLKGVLDSTNVRYNG